MNRHLPAGPKIYLAFFGCLIFSLPFVIFSRIILVSLRISSYRSTLFHIIFITLSEPLPLGISSQYMMSACHYL